MDTGTRVPKASEGDDRHECGLTREQELGEPSSQVVACLDSFVEAHSGWQRAGQVLSSFEMFFFSKSPEG
jgi:hypothetical protein